jgi:tetratricopeptide (TPR) repeat protein
VDRKPAGSETLVIDGNGNQAGAKSSDANASEPESDIQFARGVFDGGDPNYDRFKIKDYEIREEAIIASQQNSYIRFPMLNQRLSRFQLLMKNAPDYEIKEQETPSNKEVQLLLTFFKTQKWGSFFETLKYTQKKFPQSQYQETIDNLVAEAHIRLFERDKDPKDYEAFRAQYRNLIEQYPDSVLTERNHQLLIYSGLEANDGAETLRDILKYEAKYPNSSESDYLQLAKAEAYVLLSKPQDAIRTLEDLSKKAKNKNLAVEASYRLGDVYFGQKKYSKALEVYQAVQNKYPQHKALYANAQYNQSESQFWLGQHKNSLNSYIEFLKLFPTHNHGGFALTRIGELLEILGADQRRVMGAFLEGYFRYPDSPGSEVARIRMLSQGLKNMQEREKKRAIEEIDTIAKKSKLPEILEFVTLMKSDGFSRRKEFRPSLDLLLSYYQEHPTNVNVPVFRARILRNISDILKEEVEKQNYIEALNFYGKYSTTWLKNADRVDTAFFQAYAYEHAGVFAEAEKSYQRIRSQLTQMAGKKVEKERKIYEHLPTVSEVNLRLAAIASENRMYRDAYKYLKEITKLETTEEEIEKVQIGAVVAENMGDTKTAIQNLDKLVQSYTGKENLMIRPEIQLARLNMKVNSYTAADKNLSHLEALKAKGVEMADTDWAKTMELRADWQFKNGQKLAAVETYIKLLDQYESKLPLASLRYQAGKILFDEGDLKGAEKIWSSFEQTTGSFYSRLAQEKLSQAQWQDTYKKYIDRIPAAENLK